MLDLEWDWSHNVGNMNLSNLSSYALIVESIETLELRGKPNFWNTTPPPPPYSTHWLRSVQSSKYQPPANLLTQICYPREHVSTVLVSWVVCFTALHLMLCVALCDVRFGYSCSDKETHSMKFSVHTSWTNLKATWNLKVRNCLCRCGRGNLGVRCLAAQARLVCNSKRQPLVTRLLFCPSEPCTLSCIIQWVPLMVSSPCLRESFLIKVTSGFLPVDMFEAVSKL